MIFPGDIARTTNNSRPRLWYSNVVSSWNDEWSIKLTNSDIILVVSLGDPYVFVLVNGFAGYVNASMIVKVQL